MSQLAGPLPMGLAQNGIESLRQRKVLLDLELE